MRNYILHLLSEDYRVMQAGDGAEAFELAKAHLPDIIISDIMMPRLDGYGLLLKLRKDPQTKNLPVIFLSARAGEEAKVEGLDAGADDYLVKPFSAKELKARISALIKVSTARKKLEENEYHFRSLTMALPQLVWVTDSSGRQEFVTDRWKEYTGLEPTGEFTWAEIIHPDDTNTVEEAWKHSLQTGETYKAEVRLRGKDGIYRWFHVQGEPIRNEKNNIIKWVGAFTDINEQKLAEELLRQSEENLEILVKKRTEELERSNEDLQQFAHVASHDMKEPIRKIKIFSELLSDAVYEESSDEAKIYLNKIKTASERMLAMMDGVLRYAGMDGYQQAIEPIDLNEVIRSVEMDLEIVIQKKNAVILSDELPRIQGYPLLIYQLFYNLFSNALKFSRPDIEPVIEIRYSRQNLNNRVYHQFRFRDNGIGFDQENAEKIFQTFTRLNTREDYEGTGLGLSLCKKIVHRHHGFLTAHGAPNLGAEFVIMIPQGQMV
jgi:PAS domain S-box-containing protein